jgi:hypothetical protein
MFEVINWLKTEIHEHFEHMKVINENFGFLKLDFLLKSDNNEVIDKEIDSVAGFYDEINAKELKQEIHRRDRSVNGVLAFGSRDPSSTPSRGKSFFVTTLGKL